MKRVVVTGGTGFVGANLTRRLLRDGHEIHLVVRPEHTAWRIESIRREVGVHVVALTDLCRLTTLMSEVKPDWVFHLGAYGAYPTQHDLNQMIQTNLHGTINLVQACVAVGFEAFVHSGSSSEYGFKDHAPSEDELIEPNSHYAVTKSAATLFCQFTARHNDVNIATLRLYSVFGPYEEPTRLIPSLIIRGLRGELPDLVDPSVARDFVYVDDVNDAFILAASQPFSTCGRIFNVGTGVQTSIREAVDEARQLLRIAAEPRWGSMANRSWDSASWVANSSSIREKLGWNPRYSFAAGFEAFLAWIRDNPSMRAHYLRRVDESR
jgi:UDP-glucose 4-epimerase